MKRIFILALLCILTFSVAESATFTSVTGGNWNDGATWGNTSPGNKGTDWPGTAGDVVNIGTTANQTHVVIYNVSETNALGAITIGAATGSGASVLSFARDGNTKLTVGAVNITVAVTGELRIGTTGAVIPAAYVAELVFATSADNTTGLVVNAGGKVNMYGDPAYFGSSQRAVLVTQAEIPAATNAYTITVSGDYTTKWAIGQEIIIHSGTTFAAVNHDFARLAITGVAANGANTDIATTVTERTKSSTLTCLVGADVLNMSRNVRAYKLSYSGALSTQGTNRVKMTNSNALTAIGTGNIVFSDVELACWGTPITGNNVRFNGVIRNGNYGARLCVNSSIDGIVMGGYRGVDSSQNTSVGATFISGYTGERAICFSDNMTFTGSIFGWTHGSYNNNYSTIGGYIYSNGSGGAVVGGKENKITASMGYSPEAVAMANSTDFSLQVQDTYGGYGRNYVSNAKVPEAPVWNATYLNNFTTQGRYCFDNYKQTAGSQHVQDAYGTVTKVAADGASDRPSRRTGGSEYVIEALPVSNTATNTPLELLNSRKVSIWAKASVSKTYRFYVQSAFTTLASSGIKLYADYLDQATGGRRATTSSTQDITTRDNTSDWDQYLEVTVSPSQDGVVNFWLSLMTYQNGTTKVWIDPQIQGFIPRWSFGEIYLIPTTFSNIWWGR